MLQKSSVDLVEIFQMGKKKQFKSAALKKAKCPTKSCWLVEISHFFMKILLVFKTLIIFGGVGKRGIVQKKKCFGQSDTDGWWSVIWDWKLSFVTFPCDVSWLDAATYIYWESVQSVQLMDMSQKVNHCSLLQQALALGYWMSHSLLVGLSLGLLSYNSPEFTPAFG